MHYLYCPACGEKLLPRPLGDEGLVPWCEPCGRPYFDSFSTCIICAVLNERGEVALIQQNGVSGSRYICVAGYMKPGESAEETVRREVLEEIGQHAESIRYLASYPHRGGEQLMLGFSVYVHSEAFALSQEVDAAAWLPATHALSHIREGSIAWQVVHQALQEAGFAN